MFYFVYKTTNKINSKIYVGVHKTEDLDDGYLGSGKGLKRAINKYGDDAFSREILSFHDTHEAAFAEEAKIVNEDFIADRNTYNFKLGGIGGDTLRKRKWANNGTIEKYYFIDEIPDGWSLGRLKSSCVFSDPEKQREFANRVDFAERAKSLKKAWEDGNFDRDHSKCGTRGDENPSKRQDVRLKISKARSKGIVTPDGKFDSLTDACEFYGISTSSMYTRMKNAPEKYFYV